MCDLKFGAASRLRSQFVISNNHTPRRDGAASRRNNGGVVQARGRGRPRHTSKSYVMLTSV